MRVVDSAAKAALLRVKVREFRMVEDREPDGAMAALWRAPEVAAFYARTTFILRVAWARPRR